MKRLIPVWLACAGFASTSIAGPVDAAILATMRLSEQPNYSWVSTISDDARTYDIEGQTVRGGYTRVRMPVINAVRRQLGRSVTDTQVEFIFRGNVACVVETEAGWARPDELSQLALEGSESPHPLATTGHAPILGTRPSSGSGSNRGSILLPRGASARSRDRQDRGYSNLQLAITHPHEDLGVIVSCHTAFNVEGDSVTGTLTDRGAQLLLVRDGQDAITPLRASGKFKLWLRGGAVAKYQINLEGMLEVQASGGRRQINVTQTTETVVKDVGKTTFEVPAAARAKLGE